MSGCWQSYLQYHGIIIHLPRLIPTIIQPISHLVTGRAESGDDRIIIHVIDRTNALWVNVCEKGVCLHLCLCFCMNFHFCVCAFGDYELSSKLFSVHCIHTV